MRGKSIKLQPDRKYGNNCGTANNKCKLDPSTGIIPKILLVENDNQYGEVSRCSLLFDTLKWELLLLQSERELTRIFSIIKKPMEVKNKAIKLFNFKWYIVYKKN